MRFNCGLSRLGIAGISLAVLLANGAAHAQSVNLYNGSTTVPTIPFITTMSGGGATLSLTVGNSAPGTFVLDTGSNGILVSRINSTRPA